MIHAERNRIAKEWAGKPCPHPRFETEFADLEGGSETGNRVCLQCGETLDDIVQSSSYK